MRKLVSIREISEVLPIEGADAIELVKVDGWQVVSKKGEFQKGDFCVYFEIDSFLPVNEKFEFLRKSSFRKDATGKEGFRLRTIKLRKQLSQGLVLPTYEFLEEIKMHFHPQFTGTNNEIQSLLDTDITEWLGVSKYEAPQPPNMHTNAKGNFPYFIPKTDQERIQNLWKEYKRDYNDIEFEVTLKLDGTSATYFYNEGKLGVCSRNLELKFDISVGIRQGIFKGLKILGKNLAIQGEIIGEGIQGNKDKINGQSFYIYDIFDIDQKRYLTVNERVALLTSTKQDYIDISLFHIPIHELGVKLSEFQSLDDLLKYADGKSLNSEIREGLVFKSMSLVNGRPISFKVISNEFLLKYE
jgi:RNA ligase (TIGR02306 family)